MKWYMVGHHHSWLAMRNDEQETVEWNRKHSIEDEVIAKVKWKLEKAQTKMKKIL